jgi:hypothetical protein
LARPPPLLADGLTVYTTPDIVFDNPIGVLGEDTVQLLVGVWIVGLVALVVTREVPRRA